MAKSNNCTDDDDDDHDDNGMRMIIFRRSLSHWLSDPKPSDDI